MFIFSLTLLSYLSVLLEKKVQQVPVRINKEDSDSEWALRDKALELTAIITTNLIIQMIGIIKQKVEHTQNLDQGNKHNQHTGFTVIVLLS